MGSLRKKLGNPVKLKSQQLDAQHIGLYGATVWKGDFLYLKFSRPVMSQMIVVSWQDDFGGEGQPYLLFWGGSSEFLVPLFASSNWFMSKNKSGIIIQYADQLPEELHLEEAVLYDRTE